MKFNILRSFMIRNVSDEVIYENVNDIIFNENKEVGRGVKSGKLNSVIFGEDRFSACIGFSNGELHRLPSCIGKLIDYVKNLYDGDFKISSFSIYEGCSGRVIIDMAVPKTNEVYSYRFYIRGDRVEYDDCYSDCPSHISTVDQYFPYIDSEEPNAEIFNKLMYDVLVFCGKFTFPIKRIIIFSESDDIVTVGKKCRYGIGNSSGYYGMVDSDYDGGLKVDIDRGDYDLCILVE